MQAFLDDVNKSMVVASNAWQSHPTGEVLNLEVSLMCGYTARKHLERQVGHQLRKGHKFALVHGFLCA